MQSLAPDVPNPQQLQAALDQEPQCRRQALFLYVLGRLLNQAGRYQEAVDRLEAALLYQPDHWPSQVEFAIALAGTGDAQSATELLSAMVTDPTLPPLAHQQVALLQQHTPASVPHLMLGLATGFDDNLMGSTGHDQLELTVPGARLTLQTAPEQLARAGRFVRADFRYDGDLLNTLNARWHYSLVASQRRTDYSPANLDQLGLLVQRSATNPLASYAPYALALHQQQKRGGVTLLQQTQLGLGYDLPATVFGMACSQRLGTEVQQLRYPDSPALDGNYRGLLSQTYCPARGLQLQLRLGQDHALQTNRPGGGQSQRSLRMVKDTSVGIGKLSLEIEYTRQNDQSGYSPLLENNTVRQVQRVAHRAEYGWTAGRLRPYLSFESLRQQANLPLFDSQNQVLTLGLRSTW